MSFFYLCPTQTQAKTVEIAQAFAGEAWAAVEFGDIGQWGEVVVQPGPFCCLNIHFTVTDTSCVSLQNENKQGHILLCFQGMVCLWKIPN